jgi:hypothetical protein
MTPPQAGESRRVDEVFRSVVSRGFDPNSVVGLGDAEIDEISAAQRVAAMPGEFKRVLELIGSRPGIWFAGSSFGYEALTGSLKAQALALVPKDDEFGDPRQAFVIFGHGGYEYHAISGYDLGRADPPVWRIAVLEDDDDDEDGELGKIHRAWSSVSSWFEGAAREVLRYGDELRASPSSWRS